MSYTHFTLSERKYLQKLLSEGKSMREAARILERSPSSVSREIKRNKAKRKPKRGYDNPYFYNRWRAFILYTLRRRTQKRRAIHEGSAQWNFVLDGFQKFWSPEEIAERWNYLYPSEKRLCTSTIYRYLKRGELPNITAKKHLRRRGKNKNYVHHNSAAVHPERLILDWPSVIKMRERLGDFEGDTIYGGVGKGLLISMVDRKSRLLKLALLSARSAELTTCEIIRMLEGVPVFSISLDNGTEFSDYKNIEKALDIPVYFAEPHKPWQRGTNENTNDMVRFFFKKGFNFRTVTPEDMQFVEDLLNNRPRKCLGWRTPIEVFFSEGVALG